MQSLTEQVRGLVLEVLQDTEYYLVELNVRGARGSQVVEVFVDGDQGVGVDELATISREIGFALDLEDLFDSKYNLNVSTPGIDRPLQLRRQYQKNVGRDLQVHFQKPDGSGNTEVQGELLAVGEEAIDVATSEEESTTIPFESILWAKVKLPW